MCCRNSSRSSHTNLNAFSVLRWQIRLLRTKFLLHPWQSPGRCRMGKVTGFMEISRELPQRRAVAERVNDWFEIYQDFPEEKQKEQGARCMDCGVPFCHTGCPVNNIIPDWK